ncbi:ABC transporter permease [Streptomyces sp. NBC_00237]|uniref:ABC transporter permease n=1 Tax=Streptomyces sp. NBC_00237 TaxID=2975687 RepID=UPI00224D5F41|nr:ABC transporter permease [Streptomyces sp. NBC_00237]MCX5202590.1 ABC transporter permease [Streptomyces sp. NBC_00237]
MLGFLTKRLGYYVVLLVVAVGLSYALASTSLTPRSYFENRNPRPAATVVDSQLNQLGINDKTPLPERFGDWASNVVQGDLGKTIKDTSVNDEFGSRIGVSLRLLLIGTILGTALGILFGAWGAIRQYKFSDRAMMIFSFLIMSMPMLLVAAFIKQGAMWFNNTMGTNIKFIGEGDTTLADGLFTMLQERAIHLLLPTLAIVAVTIASYSRYQRSTMLDVLGSDYLRTARAKGLSRNKALMKHGLRTAMIPMSTFFAYGFLGLFTGATFTEKIFGWHGMGEWLIDSITSNDVNSVVAYSLFAAVMVLLAGFVADILHAALDPRVRNG